MPKIQIIESDLTTSGVSMSAEDVVFVIGFGSKFTRKPLLFTSVSKFKDELGATAQTQGSTEQEYPAMFTSGTDYAQTSKLVAANKPDPSHSIAIELLEVGLPVLYYSVGSSANRSVADLYSVLRGVAVTASSAGADDAIAADELYTALSDTGEYDIKFITAGGYPVIGSGTNGHDIPKKFAALAGARCDVTAFIDAPNFPARPLTGTGSLWADVNVSTTIFDTAAAHADRVSINYPWEATDFDSNGTATRSIPAGIAQLKTYAKMLKSYAKELACAGVNRATVSNVPVVDITNSVADAQQPSKANATAGVTAYCSINPVTNIKPYGYCIWGNRTCKVNTDGLTATSFLNVRNMSNDIAKLCRKACQKLTFEQNNDILWVDFKSMITPTLDKMKSNLVIKNYRIVKDTTITEKAKVGALIQITPIEPVEDFVIRINLVDDIVEEA